MKKYIVYRYYNYLGNEGFQRKELTEKELREYIENNSKEIDCIEVFKKEDKLSIDVKVDINIKEK